MLAALLKIVIMLLLLLLLMMIVIAATAGATSVCLSCSCCRCCSGLNEPCSFLLRLRLLWNFSCTWIVPSAGVQRQVSHL